MEVVDHVPVGRPAVLDLREAHAKHVGQLEPGLRKPNAELLPGRFPVDTVLAPAAVDEVAYFDRRRVREDFERRFSLERMTAEYVRVYQRLLKPEVSAVTTAA